MALAHDQLRAVANALHSVQGRHGGAHTLSELQQQTALFDALPARYHEVLLQLLDRLDSSALFWRRELLLQPKRPAGQCAGLGRQGACSTTDASHPLSLSACPWRRKQSVGRLVDQYFERAIFRYVCKYWRVRGTRCTNFSSGACSCR